MFWGFYSRADNSATENISEPSRVGLELQYVVSDIGEMLFREAKKKSWRENNNKKKKNVTISIGLSNRKVERPYREKKPRRISIGFPNIKVERPLYTHNSLVYTATSLLFS